MPVGLLIFRVGGADGNNNRHKTEISSKFSSITVWFVTLNDSELANPTLRDGKNHSISQSKAIAMKLLSFSTSYKIASNKIKFWATNLIFFTKS